MEKGRERRIRGREGEIREESNRREGNRRRSYANKIKDKATTPKNSETRTLESPQNNCGGTNGI